MKKLILLLAIIVLSACSITNNYPINTVLTNQSLNGTIPIDKYLKNNFPTNSSAVQFEKKIPDIDLILNSTICFYKDYQGFYIYNVNDFWIQKNTLILLKDRDIIINYPFCSKIDINASNGKILYSKPIIALKNKNYLCFYDISACGKLLTRKYLSKNVYFFYPYLIFIKANRFAISFFTQKRPFFLGQIPHNIRDVFKFKNYLIFLENDGKLYAYNLKNLELFRNIKTSYQISNFVYSNNILLIKTKKHYIKFIKLIPLANSITFKVLKTFGPFKNVILARHSLYAYGDGKIYGLNSTIICDKPLKDFDFVDGIVFSFLREKKELFVFKLKKIFYKKIIFAHPHIKAYKEKDFIILFDIDGKEKIIDLSDNSTILATKYIDTKCLTPLIYLHGKLYKDREAIYKLAKIVNKNANWLMLRRTIGDNIYFYFEKTVKKSPENQLILLYKDKN